MALQIEVKNQKNSPVRQMDLSEAVFGYPLRIPLIHEAVRHYLARGRSGAAATKTRGEVQGSGRKPWKQKKTGRARIGSIRSPIWRGGGITFGPHPRSYGFRFPRKMRRNAIRSVLSEKLREKRLRVADDLSLPEPKTRLLVELLEGRGLPESVLIIDRAENRNLHLAARNLPRCKAVSFSSVNVYDLLDHEILLFTEVALGSLTEELSQ